ncbi:ArnT family glycosyltransferase [candidate division CSSED10-310 bacterium]|uniref:ArnT family glycosyltransferase n=1 Tax=candidate division CSSED10-310 bacterium TaxID=2855610 RepID=A0ABV6YY74_UNCC1
MCDSNIDKIAPALALCFTIFLLIFGLKFHPIEELHAVERDDYISKAEKIRAGTIPRDPFRPLFYPLVTAGLASIIGDMFSSARVTSSLFAGLFVWLTYLLGRQCFSRQVGLFALLALMLNYNTIIEGVHVMTDMTFSALALLTLLLTIYAYNNLRGSTVLLPALSFSLAYFTRYTAVALIPTIIISFFYLPAAQPLKKALNRLALFILATALFLLPHFILTTHVFGNPFYNENWKNLAYKVHPRLMWAVNGPPPFDGLWSVIAYAPSKFFMLSWQEGWRFIYPRLSILGGEGIAGVLFTAATLAGIYSLIFTLDRKKILILSFFFFYIALICASFTSFNRLMLPIMPLCYLLIGHFFFTDIFRGSFYLNKFNLPRTLPIIIIFLVVSGAATVPHLQQFIQRHPLAELAAARFLQENYGAEISVLGSVPTLGRYVNYKYSTSPPGTAKTKKNKAQYYLKLRQLIIDEDVDYLIVGSHSLRNRPPDLVHGKNLPPFLHPLSLSGEVVIYQVVKHKLK